MTASVRNAPLTWWKRPPGLGEKKPTVSRPCSTPTPCAWSRASVIAGLMWLPRLGWIRSNYARKVAADRRGQDTCNMWKEQLFLETKPSLIPGSARVTAREQRCSVSPGLISGSRLLKFAKVHHINDQHPQSISTSHASPDFSLFFFFFIKCSPRPKFSWVLIIASKDRPILIRRAVLKRCNYIHNCFTLIYPQVYSILPLRAAWCPPNTGINMFQTVLLWAYQLGSSSLFICLCFSWHILPDIITRCVLSWPVKENERLQAQQQ